jgi:NADH-quinone oxidoreductase subunit N
MTSADISAVLPEIILAVYAMAALMFGVYTTKDKCAPLLVWVTSGVFVLVGLMVGFAGAGTTSPSAACSSTTPIRASPR